MRKIATARCILEPQLAAHAPEMFEVLSDPAIYKFENEPPSTVEALRSRYQRQEVRGSDDGKQVWLNWVIRVPSGHLAGYVQATVLPDSRAYVAYELNSRYWRQGIGLCSVQAMLAELRASYGVAIAIAVLKAKNYRSEALLHKLGFKRATPAEEARYRDTDDEIAFTKELALSPDAA